MRSVAKYVLACLLCLVMTATVSACLWDYDTLQMERMRFPATLEIITGKFVRHTPAYYEWRIVDRQRKLAATPDDPALLDDLAVAYGKLGRPEEGIALLEPTLARRPARYETLSNLGTLLFFAGRLDESKDYIRRALEVNPNAHFGRERYQLLLTEYLQQSEHATSGVMSTAEVDRDGKLRGFARHVIWAKFGKHEPPGSEYLRKHVRSSHHSELQGAIQGVLGMMHFADHQSPILLEALGDLLSTGEVENDATQLAARAYLRAAQLSTDPAVSEKFKKMSSESLSDHIDFDKNAPDGIHELEAELAQEMAAANEWYVAIETKERQWIAEKRDVDAAFAAEYYDDSLASTVAAAEEQLENEPRQPRRISPNEALERLLIVVGLILVGIPVTLISVAIVAVFWWHRRRRIAATRLPSVPQSPVT